MSSGNQHGTKAFVIRWNGLQAFWREKRRGLYDKDITDWRMSEGLTPRTARENYWDAGEQLGIIRVVYEQKQKFWEYCKPRVELSKEQVEIKLGSPTPFTDYPKSKKYQELQQKIKKTNELSLKNHSIKEEMKSEECKNIECPPFSEESCEYCTNYIQYIENKKAELMEGRDENGFS